MEYIKIPLHGKYGKGKYTLVDGDYDGEYFSQYKWYLLAGGYVARAKVEYPSSERNTYIYLHKEVCKAPKGMVADHINRDKLDNRSCNLRWATYSENRINSSDVGGHVLTADEKRNKKRLYYLRYYSIADNRVKKKNYDKLRYLKRSLT